MSAVRVWIAGALVGLGIGGIAATVALGAAQTCEPSDAPTFGTLSPPRALSWVTSYRLPLVGETLRPPLQYQGNARSVIEVIEPEKIEGECFAGGPGALACTKMYPGRPTIVMPNPCAFPFDSYAVMLCHEVGHVNGWEHGSGA